MRSNELLLLSSNDIPFPELGITVHNPTLKEIALIGEELFFKGIQILNINKDFLDEKDKTGLEDKDDFDILMSIVCSANKNTHKIALNSFLLLLFPNYFCKFEPIGIVLLDIDCKEFIIDKRKFQIFKDIINSMFAFEEGGDGKDYNPADARAAKIAEKLRKGKNKAAQSQGANVQKVAILSRYVSILAVGEHKDINSLMNYTVYQIKDELERFRKKENFDIIMQAKMAGASGNEEVDNWMNDIHS